MSKTPIATKTTVRLSKMDERHVAVIVKSGAARGISDAIRIALYEAAERRANKKEVA